MEYSKEFVTAVVLGKDLVPRQITVPSLHCPAWAAPPSSGPHLGSSPEIQGSLTQIPVSPRDRDKGCQSSFCALRTQVWSPLP